MKNVCKLTDQFDMAITLDWDIKLQLNYLLMWMSGILLDSGQTLCSTASTHSLHCLLRPVYPNTLVINLA